MELMIRYLAQLRATWRGADISGMRINHGTGQQRQAASGRRAEKGPKRRALWRALTAAFSALGTLRSVRPGGP
jgi:hypothetical protein